jgi:predicted phage terminase large subunit-like protein
MYNKAVPLVRAEAEWVRRARSNPADFTYYLTEMRPAKHHLVWWNAMLSGNRVNIVSPREAAKTTILVYTLAWLIGKNPFLTHFLGSVTLEQAQDRLSMIRDIIQYNDRYHNVFPGLYIDTKRDNNKSEFSVWSEWVDGQPVDYTTYRILVGHRGSLKDPTLFAAGAGSSQTIGRRFSGFCLVDDPHSESNSATEDLRNKIDDWYHRTLLPCVKEEGKAVVISTRWADTDLSGRLKAKPMWNTIEIPAITPATGESYWPEYWPLEKLEAKRAEIGEVMFQLMYLNNPNALASGQFTLDMLSKHIPERFPDLDSLVIATDFAKTTNRSSDYSVFAAIGRSKERPYDIYVFDLWRGKVQWLEVFDQLSAFAERVMLTYGRLDKILIEKQGMSIGSEQELKARYPELPVALVPIRGDKGDRLDGVAAIAQRGGLYINTHMADYRALVSEILGFPRATHDDCVDAISLPIQYWGGSSSRSGILSIRTDEPARKVYGL